MSKRETDTIILGSGDLFYKEFTGTLPTEEEICIDANFCGGIQGGASIEYKPSFYESKDDSGKHIKTILTDEEALFKSGLMTRIGQMLDKITNTAAVTTANGRRTVKIGGVGNFNRKSYIWCFRHEDEIDGDIYVMVVGQNQAGFTLQFTKDKESIVDLEIKCLPQDDRGTLIRYTEEVETISKTASVNSENLENPTDNDESEGGTE